MAAKSPVKDTPPPAAKPETLSSADAEADVVNVPSYSGKFNQSTEAIKNIFFFTFFHIEADI